MNASQAEQNQSHLQPEDRARHLAEAHRMSLVPDVSTSLLDRLPVIRRVLREAHIDFARAQEKRATLSGVAEWVLDNHYVIREAIRQVEEDMPKGYYRRLPKLHESQGGYPRIYRIAHEIIEVASGHVDIDRVQRFVRGYQKAQSLTMGEIWAVPTMLRLSILEFLAWTVARATEIDLPLDDEAWPEFEGFEAKRDEAIVAAAINSLRVIGNHEWDDFFEATSLVEEILRLDPVNVYSAMDFDTRDRYRGVVEELARATEHTEQEVAQETLRLARRPIEKAGQDGGASDWPGARAEHVGFYLIGQGREQLEEAIDFRPGLLAGARRWILHHPTSVYLGAIAIISGLISGGALVYAYDAGGGAWSLLGVGLLTLLPASMVGVNLTNLVVTRAVKPGVLPKLDFSNGIPRECRTVVVIPALLSSEDEVDFLLRQLELHYQGNTDPQLGFALLGDFSDAPRKHMPDDGRLLQRAKEGIKRLNRKYGNKTRPEGAEGPFYLFQRERLWNPKEDCWMGWERKRGKLVEFNRLLRGDQETSYVVALGDLGFLSEVTYVITLDADTAFPLDSGHRLIGTLAHPLNRAEFDVDAAKGDAERRALGKSVVSRGPDAGYTVLQPRTEVKPTAVTQTWFSRIFAGDAGLDLYTRAVSDVYQDLFGEGIYIGKGIYDVDAFERSLRGRVPENALLSHDLFEGIHGRAGLVTDVVLFEDYPPSYLSYAHRKHRWVRGDWQILPWLLPSVPHAGEGTIPNTLSTLDRWKILDNLRRSLRSPALLALLVIGWICLPGSPLVWTLIGVVTSGVPLVTGAATEMARRLRGAELGLPQSTALGDMGKETLRWLLSIVFLPYESILMGDAIATTLVRLTISHKRLLQWTTAAHTVRLFGRQSKIGLLWRQMRGGSILGLLIFVVLVFFRPIVLPFAAPFFLCWLLSPVVAAWISQPVERDEEVLSDSERRKLRRLARRTWLFFERFVGPDDHWLPPDHFQEDPRGTVAHRTSPTNIGLMLLSSLSAYDLGYIGLTELSLRTADAFDSMDQLQRYRGHFLNWYDTSTLDPLAPRYVSTVDSGNLAACLIVLRQGLEQLKHQRPLHWQRWRGLLDTLDVLGQAVKTAGQEEAVEEAAAEVQRRIGHVCQKVLSVKEEPEHWMPLLTDLEGELTEGLKRRLQALADAGSGVLDTAKLRDFRLWSERVHLHVRDVRSEMERILPWVFLMNAAPEILVSDTPTKLNPALGETWRKLQERLPTDPVLEEIGGVCREAQRKVKDLQRILRDELKSLDAELSPDIGRRLEGALEWSDQLEEALRSARRMAEDVMTDLDDLTERAESYVQEMCFRFLYDGRRDVFHIGYRVDSEQLDRNHYDLLASEARIASIVAISKGEVPQRHWLHLNRPMSCVDGLLTLLSWGGSMFEYLMPDLMMHRYEGTLLEQANRAAVRRQIAYMDDKGVPWGISESGYYRFDAQLNYQYRGFGVPGLGRKRGLSDDLVIAPYASLLAVSVTPAEVLKNIDALVELGMQGHYGLYESLDYTESRLPMGQRRAVVRSYMAHHQGMILIALSNYLQDRAQGGVGIVGRFHNDPRIQSVEFLLQEQVPHAAPLEEVPEEPLGVQQPEGDSIELEPWSVPTDPPMPQVQLLSNGQYGLLITDAGAGYSTYSPRSSGGGETIALTRWRADTTLDRWGTWIYVQDRDSGVLWSAAEQPTRAPVEDQQVRFYPHQADFWRRHRGGSLHTEITVAPEDDVEIRRVTLTNHSDEPRRLRVSSYGEVVLADRDHDRRHPAFNKMFIESERLPGLNGLLFTRRPRSPDEELPYLAHLLITPPDLEPTEAYESDRARFIGRGRTAEAPAAFRCTNGGAGPKEAWLSGTVGSTLDPIFALGQEVEMEPHASVEMAYVTLAAQSQEDALQLARRYQSWHRINRTFDQAHAQSEVELRNLELDIADVEDMMRLLSALLYPHRSLRADSQTLAANRLGQSALWRYGISGDYPILLLRISDKEQVPLVREVLRAHAYWRDRQRKIDLVILNEKDVGYAQELDDQLNQVITQMDSGAWLNRRGGIFVLRSSQMGKAEMTLLKVAARAVLEAGEGSLHEQLRGMLERPSTLPAFQPTATPDELEATPPLSRPDDLRFDNGFGGFSADGHEYVVYLDSGPKPNETREWTPAPWINVIANPGFGFLVSGTGLGYSWAGNSGENRLTPWRNDPVSGSPAEALYLRDEETAEVWSPTPLPAGEDAPYIARHGAGYSVFEHRSHGLKQRLRLFAIPMAPVKVIALRLENTWTRVRRLTATFFAEWVLGSNREETQQYVVSEYDAQTKALLARNTYHSEFRSREGGKAAVAFLVSSADPHGLTADRTEFLGRKSGMRHPAALDRVGLGGNVEPGLDPCAAMQMHVELEPGEAKEIFFLLGQGEDRDHALTLIKQYRDDEEIAAAWEQARGWWDDLLGTVWVNTPDAAMNLMLNRWLLYQALSCRVWGRSALYQSSGAFGFRDQLQDVMSLMHADPELVRQHILRAARHQFEEGDVLHWWHPPSGRGVRTRISDDLLWLPYVTAQYVETTGDEEILDQMVPFRKGEPLDASEEERYGHYDVADEKANLYEHCLRAVDKGSTSGRHGLPLIGAGDWNDGLNRVGVEGEGESVWLGWFLYATLSRFARLCERKGDTERAETFQRRAQELQGALRENAWDGAWYIRATYDDGTPLGSSQNAECKIASLAQSWAVLSEAGDGGRVGQAMASVADWLVRKDDEVPDGLVLLFTPPFDKTRHEPGYIKAYPPGIRENGGQYTHAAIWVAWAYAQLGQGDRAYELLRLLNPICRTDTREKAQRYQVEPYVVAADIYSADQHLGKGGWTWYTGSAGWMYRLGIEAILGLRREDDKLRIEPCIPKDWRTYEMTYRHGETAYEIEIENPEGVNRGIKAVILDGEELPDDGVPLLDDGEHHRVRVRMG